MKIKVQFPVTVEVKNGEIVCVHIPSIEDVQKAYEEQGHVEDQALRMQGRYYFVRKGDGKVFDRILFYGHWTDIQAEDGEGDSVKWYGPDSFGYVSNSKGFTYDKRTVDPEPRETD